MGVQGLWSLLQPAARPIKLEDLEGKRFAVDSSIWLYHFRMAMRDKEGRTLANAHILGFFWRICKLLHFGLRPVFVFDGGAPVMKRQTLIGRKTRKAGAKESHALAAKKLLNAQMRQAALEHVAAGQGQSQSRGDAAAAAAAAVEGDDEDRLPGNVVYFDEYEPSRVAGPSRTSASPSKPSGVGSKEASPVKKKNIDYHRDPYALPSLDQSISSMTASTSRAGASASEGEAGTGGPRKGRRNDFRFATDSELRHLLSSITPSDIDMSSPLFRSLPPELQYELVGDMRAASRGTSYKRLQQMLKTSPTAIDFSRAQISMLKNRNTLTQKVFDVTGEIGDGQVKIPVRVSGERNREYVLIRKEGGDGGFVLGVRNQAGTTQEKAIVVGEPEQHTLSSDEDDEDDRRRSHHIDDDDIELEEVDTGGPSAQSQSRSPSNHFVATDANNPEVRRAIAEQLINKRAAEHLRQRLRDQGVTDEAEILEQQLQQARERAKQKGTADQLFTRRRSSSQRPGPSSLAHETDDQDWSDVEEGEDDNELKLDELEDFARALEASKADAGSNDEEGSDASDSDIELVSSSGAKLPAANQQDDDEMEPVVGFDAGAYASVYDDGEVEATGDNLEDDNDLDLEDVDVNLSSNGLSSNQNHAAEADEPVLLNPRKKGPALGFRRSDRPGLPGKMDPRLFAKRKWYDEDEEAGPFSRPAASPSKPSPIKASPSKPSPIKASPSPTKSLNLPLRQFKASESPRKVSSDFVSGMPSPIKAAEVQASRLEASNVASPRRVSQVKVASKAKAVELELKSPLTESLEGQSQAAEVPTDSKGRPQPNIEPLPHGDDLAATQILNDPMPPPPAPSSSASTRNGKEDIEVQELEKQAQEMVEDDLSSSTGKSRAVEELKAQPAVADSAAVSEIPVADEVAQEAAGIQEDEIMTDEPIVKLEDEAVQDPVAEPSGSSTAAVTLDNPEAWSQEYEPEVEESAAAGDTQSSTRQPSYDSDEGTPIEWSPSPSPGPTAVGPDGFPLPSLEELEQMDAEYEAEAQALQGDQGDIANFISRTKGQGIIEAREELAREVQALKAEHVNTRKSEEEITKQMAREIQMMLRLFGLPYITAPMEAEAQCAELVSRKLVDGIITDDSDVFLFGGTRIYKNMFNQNKTVECFLLSDLERELGLDREKLVRLAYLLGSDYTEGLEGVGPVVAMEILSLFPGPDGLLRFKDWWIKVQSGKDTPQDTKGKTMRRIKKTLANKVHLDASFPAPEVSDAYYEPSVDTSDEAFQWGLPDLDNLRVYLGEYLGWATTKTDQYVVPVIEAQSRRSRARGNQTTLDRNGFFDTSAGSGVYAGRTLPKYGSNRLQNVVNGFREANNARKKRSEGGADTSGEQPQPAKKRKTGRAAANRNESPEDHSDEDDEDFEVVDTASTDAVPEEILGKAMAARQRPIVRREQMRVSRQEAQEELDANIAALEGELPTKPAIKRKKKPEQASDQQSQERPRPRARPKKASTSKTGAADEKSPDEATEDSDGDDVWQPSTPSKKSAPRSRRATAKARAVDATVETPPASGPAGAGSTALPTASTSPVPTRGARKPARARGARGTRGRHSNLHAARNMRLDGAIPESTSEPVRPETLRRQHSSSSSSAGTRNSRSRSTSLRRNDSLGSVTASGKPRERIEIELRSSGDEMEDADQ